MSKRQKLGVTVLLIIGYILFAAILVAAESSTTLIGMLGVGLVFGIRAMWKKQKEEISSEIKLDKRNTKENDS